MLVEIEGERVRVFAGLGMRARLVQVLGPVRALRVAQAVARHGGPVLGVDWERRRLLRQSLALAGLALLRWIPGGTHAPRTTGSASSAPPRLGSGEGELWEGGRGIQIQAPDRAAGSRMVRKAAGLILKPQRCGYNQSQAFMEEAQR